MTHQEYLDKCTQLRTLANELERYAQEQLNKHWESNERLDYPALRNYGNVEKAKLALHTIGTLAAFDIIFAPFNLNEQ